MLKNAYLLANFGFESLRYSRERALQSLADRRAKPSARARPAGEVESQRRLNEEMDDRRAFERDLREKLEKERGEDAKKRAEVRGHDLQPHFWLPSFLPCDAYFICNCSSFSNAILCVQVLLRLAVPTWLYFILLVSSFQRSV